MKIGDKIIEDKIIDEFVDKLDDLFKEYTDRLNVTQMLYCAFYMQKCLKKSLQIYLKEMRNRREENDPDKIKELNAGSVTDAL